MLRHLESGVREGRQRRMRNMLGFIIGWFLSLFATHNFGWEPTLQVGVILLMMWVSFSVLLTDKENDAKEGQR